MFKLCARWVCGICGRIVIAGVNRRHKKIIKQTLYVAQLVSGIYLWARLTSYYESDIKLALILFILCSFVLALKPNARLFKYNRAKRLKQNGGSHSERQWRDLKRHWGNKCACCGVSESKARLTKDHIVPVALGGKDSIDNLQPLCQSCNSIKGKTVVRF